MNPVTPVNAVDSSPLPGAPPTWTPPVAIDEYRILRLIGRGGMAEVYLAHDEILDRHVAVKLISGIDPHPEARERFLIEARAVARLQHPNVLTVHRVSEVDGRPCLITEFLSGTTLDHLPKPLDWRRVLELGVGLARGLAAAHRRGVLHRDIKPANALLTTEGDVKLLDFGIAKLLDPGNPLGGPAGRSPLNSEIALPSSRTKAVAPAARAEFTPSSGSTLVSLKDNAPQALFHSLTDPGALMGTPDYMPPEVWRGEPATRRSDVYSLGALLFELCVGYPPNRDPGGKNASLSVRERHAPRAGGLPPMINPTFAAVLERCLCCDPAGRYSSGDELREALEHLDLKSRSGVIPEGNPYRGLHTFEAEHRALFFGRLAEIGTLLERLRTEAMVIVAGDSGVGKSSLCRAGVLPAIEDGALGKRTWSSVRFVPGRTPLLALGVALSPILGMDETTVVRRLRSHPSAIAGTIRRRLSDTHGLVLFVDQLEELVTMADPLGARTIAEVLGHLASEIPGLRLLMSVRTDFLAPVASFPIFGDKVARALYFLKPLTAPGVRAAIVGPARATGVTFESEALVETLVEETSQAEGGLPLLQFALAELWEARDQKLGAITATALDTIGGVAGALARHADEVILAMTAAQRSAARRLLSALLTKYGSPVRRREEELIAGDPDARAALNGLVTGRLLIVRDSGHQGATYELAHEALLEGWATLRRWLAEQAGSLAVRQRLAVAAAEWERLGRVREALWSTRQVTELETVDPDDLLGREVAFAHASRLAVRRARRRRTGLLAALPLALMGTLCGIRMNSQRERDWQVAAHIDAAADILAVARADDEASCVASRSAFAHFDAFQRNDGEAAWTKAVNTAQRADHAYARAGEALESMLVVDASNARLQAIVADVLLSRALLGERLSHVEQRDDLLRRLAVYDAQGDRRQRWIAQAEVSVESTPSGAQVAISRFLSDEGTGRRLVHVAHAGNTPRDSVGLDPGSYLFTFKFPGRGSTRYPISLSRGERLRLNVSLPKSEAIPEGYVYVAPGRFLFGTSTDEESRRSFFNTVPLHAASTGAFLIARHETTYGEWVNYLRGLPPKERSLRTPRVAGLTGALELRELGGDIWQLFLQPTRRMYSAKTGELIHYNGRSRRAFQDWLQMPVSGVSLDDAQAFAAWLAATGRVSGARLCSEREWERAARGADGREFPNGAHLNLDDANFDETYGKDPVAFGPDEVGSHPASRSPFGVDDLCGNVFEWTTSALSTGEYVLRGGAYYYDATTVRSANRQVSEPTIRDANVGIRICATVTVE